MQDTIKTKGFDIIIYGTNIEKYAIIKMFWKNIFAGTMVVLIGYSRGEQFDEQQRKQRKHSGRFRWRHNGD